MRLPGRMTLFMLILSLLTAMMVGSAVSADDSQQQATFATPRLVVNASFLNIRTGPGTQYSVLTMAVGGMELPVLGVARDLVWYQVATSAGVGWVNVEFTLARGDFTRIPFADAPPPLIIQPVFIVPGVVAGVVNPGQGGGVFIPGQVVSGAGAPVTSSVSASNPTGRVAGVSFTGGDLREAPGESPNIAPGIPPDPNNVYAVTGVVNVKGENWYQITIPGIGTGWASKVQQRPIACNPGDFIVTMNIENSGVALGSEGYVVGVRGEFFTLEFTDGSRRVVAAVATTGRGPEVVSHCGGATGGSLGQGGGFVNPATVPTFPIPVQAPNHVVVNTGQLNVRSGPGGSFSVIAQVTGGVELAILGTAPDNEWFLVAGYFGQGWVDSEFVLFRGDFSVVPVIRDAYAGGPIITAVNLGQGGGFGVPVVNVPVAQAVVPVGGNRAVVNTGNLNVRSGPSGNFGIVTAIPGGTELAVAGRTRDSAWFLVQGGFGQGWVSSEFIIFRGDFNSVPIIG